MSSVRSQIITVRDYEKFLRSRGFSRREAKILCKAFDELATNTNTNNQAAEVEKAG